MADVKWIKLDVNIFDDEKVKILYSMPDGAEMVLIWVRLLCLAGKSNSKGALKIADNIPYTDQFLASIWGVAVSKVRLALETMEQLGMIYQEEDTLFITNWLMHQSGDKLEDIQQKNRERQQRYRNRQKAKENELPPPKEDSNEESKDESNATSNVTQDVIGNVNCSISNSYSSSLYLKYINNYSFSNYIRPYIEYWINYKDERNQKYKERGLQGLLTTIENQIKAFGEYAVADIIVTSAGNGWQGILWEKIKKDANDPMMFEEQVKQPQPDPEPIVEEEDDGEWYTPEECKQQYNEWLISEGRADEVI